MSKYYRIIKGPVHTGRETLPVGLLVELNEDYDGTITPNGVIRKFHSYPRDAHPDVDLFEHQVEPIDRAWQIRHTAMPRFGLSKTTERTTKTNR